MPWESMLRRFLRPPSRCLSGAVPSSPAALAVLRTGRRKSCPLRFGSIVGAGILVLTLHGKNVGYDAAINWIGQNGWGDGYLGGYTMTVAVLTELATFIFVSVLLAVTARTGAGALAGLGCSSSSPSLGDMPLNGRESANSPSLKGTPCLSTDAE